LLETERIRLLVDAGSGNAKPLPVLAAVKKNVDRRMEFNYPRTLRSSARPYRNALGMWKAPLYVTEPTMDALRHKRSPDTFGNVVNAVEKNPKRGQRIYVGDIDSLRCSRSARCADPIGFTFKASGAKFALVTGLIICRNLGGSASRDADCLCLNRITNWTCLKVGPFRGW